MGDHRPKIEQRILHQALRALLLLSLALFQTSLAPTFWRFRVEWVLLAVVGWTMLRGLAPGVRWAVYGGVSLDLLGALPLGSHLLALLLCVIAVAFITEPLDRDQLALLIAIMLGASLLYGATLALILALTGTLAPWHSYALAVIVPTALVNTIVAIPFFALLRRLERRGQQALDA
jgi:rod shape-determining protein MreD